MKQRLDYVTNSSSSSFLIARSEDLSEKQKENILEAVKGILGSEVIRTKNELKKYFEENYYEEFDEDGKMIDTESYLYDRYMRALEALEKGLSIYCGSVSFEGDWEVGNIYNALFNALDDGKNFIDIDTSLEY